MNQTTQNEVPMTVSQRSYLKALCDKAGVNFHEDLTKAQASNRIDELIEKTKQNK